MWRILVLGIKVESGVGRKVGWLPYGDKECLSVVVMNTLACTDNQTVLLYSRDTGGRTLAWHNNPKGISNYRVVKAVDWLEDQGYVVNTIASQYQMCNEDKNLSYLTPTQLFIDKFDAPGLQEQAVAAMRNDRPVVTIRKDGVDQVYRKTQEIAGYEQAMRSMNNNNAQFNVINVEDRRIDTNYGRVFTDNTAHQGRMYGVVTHMKHRESKNRLRLKIDGKDVVEVDYNAIHPRLFAIRHGKMLPQGDLYKNFLGDKCSDENRAVLKLCMVSVLNCPSRATAMLSFRGALADVAGHTFNSPSEVMKVIENGLGDAANHLYTPMLGLSLMYTESCIMSDVVALFVSLGKPCLPVHDSAVVLAEDRDLLATAMADYFRQHTNTTEVVTMKWAAIVDGKSVKDDLFL